MLSQISSIDIETVKQHGLPGAIFSDTEIFDTESRALFSEGWMSIGCGQQLPEVGDVLPVTIAGHSLIAVRGNDGAIGVFHNVCRHKGAPLVDEPCNKRVLVCPYHRWAYQLDGSLRGAPYYHGDQKHPISDEEKADKGLIAVRFAIWWDIIFVNVSGSAPNFGEFIAPLEAELTEYNFDNIRPLSATEYAGNCNWKLAVDNFLDGYHVPFVHSQAVTVESVINQEELFLSEDIVGLRLPNGASDKPSKTFRPMPSFSGLDELAQQRQQWFGIFPNTLFFVDPCWVQTICVRPQSSTHSTESLCLYTTDPSGLTEELAEERKTLSKVLNEVNEQDVELLDKLQRTRSTPAANTGSLVPAWDQVSATFNANWLSKMQRYLHT